MNKISIQKIEAQRTICSYSAFLSKKSLNDFRNKITGITIDGAAFINMQELLDIFYEFTFDALLKEVVDGNLLFTSFEYYLANIQRNQKRSSIKYWECIEKFSFNLLS